MSEINSNIHLKILRPYTFSMILKKYEFIQINVCITLFSLKICEMSCFGAKKFSINEHSFT